MPFRIETFESGTIIDQMDAGDTESGAIAKAKAMPTPKTVDFIRVVDDVPGSAGVEIWSERRDT